MNHKNDLAKWPQCSREKEVLEWTKGSHIELESDYSLGNQPGYSLISKLYCILVQQGTNIQERLLDKAYVNVITP